MSMIITCECGYVIRGAVADELVRAARAHLAANHPAIGTHATDADFLAMAETLDDEPS
jgi:hypothetical protein